MIEPLRVYVVESDDAFISNMYFIDLPIPIVVSSQEGFYSKNQKTAKVEIPSSLAYHIFKLQSDLDIKEKRIKDLEEMNKELRLKKKGLFR